MKKAKIETPITYRCQQKEYENTVDVLSEAAKHCPNTVAYTALGDSYKATGQNTNAEAAYLHAWHMNPSRFYPKYLLAKLYHETGQCEKAVEAAKELLEKKIKVESTAIKEIKAEMLKILWKDNTRIFDAGKTKKEK